MTILTCLTSWIPWILALIGVIAILVTVFGTCTTQSGWITMWFIGMVTIPLLFIAYWVFIKKSNIPLDLTDIATISAALYFLYQIMAGALFATTSITLEGNRIDSKNILVKATIERGDQWLVQIEQDVYSVNGKEWKPIHFMGRQFNGLNLWGKPRGREISDGILRLAPKEKAQAHFIVSNATPDSEGNVTIAAKIVSFAVMWPIKSESFAKIIVPPKERP